MSCLQARSPAQWEEQIYQVYRELPRDVASVDGKRAYITEAERWPAYGCAFYEAKQYHFKKFPTDVLLGINLRGILVLRRENKEVRTYCSHSLYTPLYTCITICTPLTHALNTPYTPYIRPHIHHYMIGSRGVSPGRHLPLGVQAGHPILLRDQERRPRQRYVEVNVIILFIFSVWRENMCTH